LLLAFALSVAAASSTTTVRAAPSEDDGLAKYRERFKLGLDRYKEGALAEAIGYWRPIYAELGEKDGYRLAYNLGVAYAELGDATRAAEHLEAFLAQVDARRSRGDAFGALVSKDEADARARMADLVATRGRIRVSAPSPPPAAKVDGGEPRLAGFMAWVAPGDHTVTYAPGTPDAETKTVTVSAGAIVEVTPAPAPAPTPTPTPTPAPAPAPTSTPASHPFSPQLLVLATGVSAAAGVVAIVLDVNANNLRENLVQSSAHSHVISPSDRSSFDLARTGAYVAIGSAAALGATTAGLMVWYFAASDHHESAVVPVVSLGGDATTVGLAGRF
jgi:hypothetical protein